MCVNTLRIPTNAPDFARYAAQAQEAEDVEPEMEDALAQSSGAEKHEASPESVQKQDAKRARTQEPDDDELLDMEDVI